MTTKRWMLEARDEEVLFRLWCLRRYVLARARVHVRGRCVCDRGGLQDRSHQLCAHWHAMLLLPLGPLGSIVTGGAVVVGVVMPVVAADVDTGAVVVADPIAALT